VLLGDGVRIFDQPGGTKVRLAPVRGETAHWYSIIYDEFSRCQCMGRLRAAERSFT
jgi:hypothetical protein